MWHKAENYLVYSTSLPPTVWKFQKFSAKKIYVKLILNIPNWNILTNFNFVKMYQIANIKKVQRFINGKMVIFDLLEKSKLLSRKI